MSRRPPVRAFWPFVAALRGPAGVLWSRILDYPAVTAPFALPWWVLAVAFALAMLCMAHVTFQGESHSIELNAVPMLIGLVFCSTSGLFAANFVAVVVMLVVIRRQPPIKAAFNLANSMLELAVAVIVFGAVLGPESAVSLRGWLACYAAMLVSFVASALAITAVISLSLRRIERSASLLVFGGAIVLVTTALGVLTVTIMWDDWRGLWLVAVAVGVGFTRPRALSPPPHTPPQ